MRLSDFDFYRDFLLEKSGVELSQEKAYLLDSRLTPIARKWGYPNIETLTMVMRGVPPADLAHEVIEAMTTNETCFFRDLKPFVHFRDITLPSLMQARKAEKEINIWCAGCSTGQEPYSLAMLWKELPRQNGWNYNILATDISNAALLRAERGEYTQSEVQRGLSTHLLVKYFDQKDGMWLIKPEIKSMVDFSDFNLMDPMKQIGTADVIFCRNVLAHFDHDTRINVLHGLARTMAEDGILYLGIHETIDGPSDMLRPLPGTQGVFIRKK